jgi:flagellar basal-body rod protein FlgC
MIDPLLSASRLASAGLEAQSLRMRVVSENLANAQSTGATPGSLTLPFASAAALAGSCSVRNGALSVPISRRRTEATPAARSSSARNVTVLRA